MTVSAASSQLRSIRRQPAPTTHKPAVIAEEAVTAPAKVEPAAVFESKKAVAVADAGPPSPKDVAERYFTALNARDDKALDGLYAKGAHFDDNVFHFQDSAGIRGMWSKLPKDAQVKHQIVSVDGNTVTAKLDWDYTLFGKKVHNAETAKLTVVDGKITAQKEHFDFGAWAHQLAPIIPAGLLNFAEPVLAPLLRLAAP